MPRVAYFINKKSGLKRGKNIQELIKNNLPRNIEPDFLIWETKEELDAANKKVLEGNYDIVVAAGGDGTVNGVASLLKGTNTALYIMPLGSGNGMCRCLNYPLNLVENIKYLEKYSIDTIDIGLCDNRTFVATCGVGFDAQIAKYFAGKHVRGLLGYVYVIVKQYPRYKRATYEITLDDKTKVKRKALLVTIANAQQFGNNATISPEALLDDGLLNVTVLKKIPWYGIPIIAYRLFFNSLHKSPHVETYSASKIEVDADGPMFYQYDGEPGKKVQVLKAEIVPQKLKVIKGR